MEDKKITIILSVNYGSDYQQDFFHRMLHVMLDTLKSFMEQSHRNNKVSYEIDTHDGYKTIKK